MGFILFCFVLFSSLQARQEVLQQIAADKANRRDKKPKPPAHFAMIQATDKSREPGESSKENKQCLIQVYVCIICFKKGCLKKSIKVFWIVSGHSSLTSRFQHRGFDEFVYLFDLLTFIDYWILRLPLKIAMRTFYDNCFWNGHM